VAPRTSPESENLELNDLDYEIVPLDQSRDRRETSRGWLGGKRGVFAGIGIGLALALGGMLVLPRLSSRSTPSNPLSASSGSVQSVTVGPVEQGSVVSTVSATGTVAAADLLPVLPRATGIQIQQVLVDEGDTVRAGQTMAILDNSVLQAQLNQAQAQQASAEAIVRQKQAAVAQARATLVEAQTNRNRYAGLASQGAISRQESESRNTAAATAQEQVRLAQADVSSAQAEVQSRRAQVQQLQTQLAQTLVQAPAAGIVAERIARVGDVANGTQKLFSIIRGGALELQVKLPAIQLASIQPGAAVRVSSTSNDRVRLQGQVREIAPLVDPQSRQATVKVDLPSSPLLRPGMFLQATIASGRTQGLTVPAGAVLREDNQAIVYRLEGDRAKAQPVEVGETLGGNSMARVEVKQGLSLGDRVIVSGAGFLKDGDRVRVVPEPGTANE